MLFRSFGQRSPHQPDQEEAEQGQPVVKIFPEKLDIPGHGQQSARELAPAPDGQETAILQRPVHAIGDHLDGSKIAAA